MYKAFVDCRARYVQQSGVEIREDGRKPDEICYPWCLYPPG